MLLLFARLLYSSLCLKFYYTLPDLYTSTALCYFFDLNRLLWMRFMIITWKLYPSLTNVPAVWLYDYFDFVS